MLLDPLFWLFVVVAPVVYRVLPVRARHWWLALASCTYLATVSPVSVAIATVCAGAAYVAARIAAAKPERRKLIVRSGVVVLLLLLLLWKSIPNVARAVDDESWFAQIAYPIGMSFYVFRLIHYLIEAGRGSIEDRSVSTFVAWVLFAPIFTAGPIEQYDHFLETASTPATLGDAFIGITRIAQGVLKKLLIAEAVLHGLVLVDPMSTFIEGLPEESLLSIWTYLAAFMAWGYFDFSGYSDIAIGAARLFGVRVAENFDWPMLASNMREFWRRWHITLAAWTQRYVYMPIIARTRSPYLAIYATFLTMGVWHAADLSYIAWGLYHGTGVAVALTWAKFRRQRKWGRGPVILRWWGVPVTLLYVTGSAIFSGTSGLGTDALITLSSYAFGLR